MYLPGFEEWLIFITLLNDAHHIERVSKNRLLPAVPHYFGFKRFAITQLLVFKFKMLITMVSTPTTEARTSSL